MRSDLACLIYLILPLILFFSSFIDQNKDILAEKNLKIAASQAVIEPFDTIVLNLN